MINRTVLSHPQLIDTMDVFNDGRDTRDWLRSVGEFGLADLVEKRIQTMYQQMRPADDRPFFIRLPGSELYWNKETAWDDRSRATAYVNRGPDLSLGERVYLTPEEVAARNLQ